MKTSRSSRSWVSLVIIMVLIAAMALFLASCKKDEPITSDPDTTANSGNSDDASGDGETNPDSDVAEKTISVSITYKDGATETLAITTSATSLKEALEQENLIEGEGEGSLFYITAVKGQEASWDKDNAYWAIYSGGEYMMSGVAGTEIADGDSYELVYTVS